MNVEQEIKNIKRRNALVEKDKAWETSWMRRAIIALLTYGVVVIFFFSAQLPHPWVNSLVPALAFVLSTLTLPIFKNMWMRRK